MKKKGLLLRNINFGGSRKVITYIGLIKTVKALVYFIIYIQHIQYIQNKIQSENIEEKDTH